MHPMLLAAQIWHYWIGFFLFFGAVLAVIAVAAGYLIKVERIRFPQGRPPEDVPAPKAG